MDVRLPRSFFIAIHTGDILSVFCSSDDSSNSQYVIASAPVRFAQGMLCEAISSLKLGIASTEERRLAMTWFILRIAVMIEIMTTNAVILC